MAWYLLSRLDHISRHCRLLEYFRSFDVCVHASVSVCTHLNTIGRTFDCQAKMQMKRGLSPTLTSSGFKHHYGYLNWEKDLGSQCHEKIFFSLLRRSLKASYCLFRDAYRKLYPSHFCLQVDFCSVYFLQGSYIYKA